MCTTQLVHAWPAFAPAIERSLLSERAGQLVLITVVRFESGAQFVRQWRWLQVRRQRHLHRRPEPAAAHTNAAGAREGRVDSLSGATDQSRRMLGQPGQRRRARHHLSVCMRTLLVHVSCPLCVALSGSPMLLVDSDSYANVDGTDANNYNQDVDYSCSKALGPPDCVRSLVVPLLPHLHR